MIVCAGGNESFDFAKSIGIGLIEASINLTKLCLERKPDKILFIGTCGLYDRGEIGEIYQSFHAFNIEFSKLDANFYTPAQNEIKMQNVSCETQDKFYKVNSSNYICQDKKAALKFAILGLELENMEAFAVFSVAKKFKIPALCYFCATNFCDKNAHQAFLENHENAKTKLREFLQAKALI